MTDSDSITEQAARVSYESQAQWRSGARLWSEATPGVRERHLTSMRALADAGLLAHQAPATEDEAAHTWYAPAYRASNGNVIPCGSETVLAEYATGDVERMNETQRSHGESGTDVFLASSTRTPWREVSS